MRANVLVIMVIAYALIAAVVGALDPGPDAGTAIASGLLWPFSALELVWGFVASFFGPMVR